MPYMHGRAGIEMSLLQMWFVISDKTKIGLVVICKYASEYRSTVSETRIRKLEWWIRKLGFRN